MTNLCISGSFYVQWHILDRCNLRCRHCYQDEFTLAREPRWTQLREVADHLLETMSAWDTRLDAAITGGEPFLKPELLELLRYLDQSGRAGDLSIITNGTIWPDYARQLTEIPGFREIRISLDGIRPGTNDKIRGKGVLEKVKTNMARWQALGVPVTVMFTVMKQNLGDVPKLLDFGKTMGLDAIIIERFFPIGRGDVIVDHMLDGETFLQAWKTVLDSAGVDAEPEDLIAYRAIRVDLSGPEPDVMGSGCVVARDGAAILPDGSLLPCRRFPLAVGNLLEHSLGHIWQESPILAALRDKTNLKGKCGTCNIDDCRGCRAMCYCLQSDYLAEDPHCWLT